jgi:hypothetical protein
MIESVYGEFQGTKNKQIVLKNTFGFLHLKIWNVFVSFFFFEIFLTVCCYAHRNKLKHKGEGEAIQKDKKTRRQQLSYQEKLIHT